MGLFSSDRQANQTNPLAPLTRDRVATRLGAKDYRFGRDADGDPFGNWEGHPFMFISYGKALEILQVRGRWGRELPAELADEVTLRANAWNADKLWPKVYVRVTGRSIAVFGELTVDYEHGVSDEQIDQHIVCGITTTFEFFAELDAAYPAAVAAAQSDAN